MAAATRRQSFPEDSCIHPLTPPTPEDRAMPVYEYQCNGCKAVFTELLTVRDMETAKVTCPKCRSQDVKRVISHIHTITKKKS